MKQRRVAAGREPKGLEGDYLNIFVLLVLYILQGIPLGLSRTMDLIFQEKHLSYDQQGVFSSVSWPYSLKIIWAPIVDSLFVKRFGRRKTWLIPVQLMIGLLMFFGSSSVTEYLGGGEGISDEYTEPDVYKLTFLFFVFYLLAATQDIAVDGWAVEMLAKRNISYASTCNAVGQTFGFFIAFTGYMGLKMYGLADLESFMYFWGIVFIVTTIAVAFLKSEPDNSSENEEDLSINEAYSQMGGIINLSSVKSLMFILFTSKVTYVAAEGLTLRKLVERGMKKEHVASLTVVVTLLNVILPGLFSKYTSTRPLELIRSTYLLRTLVSIFAVFLLWGAPDFAHHPDALPAYFFVAILALTVVSSALQCAHFVAVMAFFAQVSDPSIGGTYMTMLNTIANLGSLWPNQLVLFMVDRLSYRSCDGDVCEVIMDGFYPISFFCIVYGLVWFLKYGDMFTRLQNMDIQDWRLNSNQVIKTD